MNKSKQTNKQKTQSYFMVGSQYRYFDSTWDLQFAGIILYFLTQAEEQV